jgi:hypothetical protein
MEQRAAWTPFKLNTVCEAGGQSETQSSAVPNKSSGSLFSIFLSFFLVSCPFPSSPFFFVFRLTALENFHGNGLPVYTSCNCASQGKETREADGCGFKTVLPTTAQGNVDVCVVVALVATIPPVKER